MAIKFNDLIARHEFAEGLKLGRDSIEKFPRMKTNVDRTEQRTRVIGYRVGRQHCSPSFVAVARCQGGWRKHAGVPVLPTRSTAVLLCCVCFGLVVLCVALLCGGHLNMNEMNVHSGAPRDPDFGGPVHIHLPQRRHRADHPRERPRHR